MASAAVRDTLLTEQMTEVDAIVSVETRLIDEGERLRPIDPVWANALGELMLREGQRSAIDICVSADGTRFELAGGGGHRLAGAKAVGIEYLKAIVHSADADDRRKREVAENLHRRDLDPIERAAFVAEAVAIQKRRSGINSERSGRAIAADARWQKTLKNEAVDANVMMTVAYGWTKEVADTLGFSPSTVERDLLLFQRLAPSMVQRLRAIRHPILSNRAQLRTLAMLEPVAQDHAVALLVGDLGEPAKSMGDALARMRNANRVPSDPQTKRLSAFVGSFSRMELTEKKGAMHELRPLLPAGYRLLDPGQAEAPPADTGALDKLRTQAREALDAAFTLLIRLDDAASDENAAMPQPDEIHALRSTVQFALLGLNSGAPFKKDDAK